MIKNTLFVLGPIFLFFGVTAFAAEDITLTTYYPSPYGSYRQLDTETLGFAPVADPDTYKISHPCVSAIEGWTFYDKPAHTIMYCNGTEWMELGSSEGEIGSGFDIGGYEHADSIETTGESVYDSGSIYLNGSTPLNFSSTELLKYGNLQRSMTESWKWLKWGTGHDYPGSMAFVNMQNFSTGNYTIDWEGLVDVDQYLEITTIEKQDPITKNWAVFPTTNLLYDEVAGQVAGNIASYPKLSTHAQLDRLRKRKKLKTRDATENFFDVADSVKPASNWNNLLDPGEGEQADAGNFTTYHFSRSMALSLGRYANDKPRYCDFLVRGKKDAGQKGKSIKFDYNPDPSDPTQLSKYRATYNVALKVRLRGVTAVLRRLGGSTAAASEE